MKPIALLILSLLLPFGLSIQADEGGADRDASESSSDAGAEAKEEMDVAELLEAHDEYRTIAKALRSVRLFENLKEDEDLTVFAPTDAAFDKLPEAAVEDLMQPENIELLRNLLLFHVVEESVRAEEIESREVETVYGENLMLEKIDGNVFIMGTRVVEPDMEASNGIVHGIDTVLVPPSL